MAFRLMRINFLLLVITFHRYIYKWLCGLYPPQSRSNVFLWIVTFIGSILFCFFVLYPLLLMMAYFLTCKYYHYSILLALGYFTVPWISSGFCSLWRYEYDMANASKLSQYLTSLRPPTSASSIPGPPGRFTLLNPGLVRIPETTAPPFESRTNPISSASFSDVSTQTGGSGDACGALGECGDAGKSAARPGMSAVSRRRKKKKQVQFHAKRKRKTPANQADDDSDDDDDDSE